MPRAKARATTDNGASQEPVESEPIIQETEGEIGVPSSARLTSHQLPFCGPESQYEEVTSYLQEIQEARGRPLFVLAANSIDENVCELVYL